MSLQPPLANSFWVEPGRILAGEYPAGADEEATQDRLQRLLDAGIDCFIDLTEPGEMDAYEGFLPGPYARDPVVYLRKPIPDHGLPQSADQMQEILDEIDAALAEGRRIYLHCRAGIGRTNLVAGCWFASAGASGDAALVRLNERWQGSARSRSWPTVPETDAQSDFVRDWQPMRPLHHEPAPVEAAPAVAAPAADLRDRMRGLFIGLAAGDALGHAAHGLAAGCWSDKAAMALCLAESLVAKGGHDAGDQVERYRAWQRSGHWSSTGSCVGISAATQRALATAQWTGNPYAGSHDPAAASAEPLARIGPAIAWHAASPQAAIEAAVNCARVTHQAPLTLDAVRYFAALLSGALAGDDKAALLEPLYSPIPGYWDTTLLRPRVREVAAGSWRGRKPRRVVAGENAAAAALEAALWAFESGEDLAACLKAAASRGHDPNTVAAIVGQLAGAHYGASALPSAWRGSLARSGEIEALADALHDAAPRRAAV
ncbi:MAG: ADP-ribosylglycohydrolase family protein [Steroidobacteraceae bacterium]